MSEPIRPSLEVTLENQELRKHVEASEQATIFGLPVFFEDGRPCLVGDNRDKTAESN